MSHDESTTNTLGASGYRPEIFCKTYIVQLTLLYFYTLLTPPFFNYLLPHLNYCRWPADYLFDPWEGSVPGS